MASTRGSGRFAVRACLLSCMGFSAGLAKSGSCAALLPGVALPLSEIPSGLVLADIDADNHVDLLYIGASGVHVRPGHGDGTFAAETTFGGAGSYLEVADLDADDRQDVSLGVTFAVNV